jgi:hypothetical protein
VAGTTLDDVRRALRRTARNATEIGPDKAAAWGIIAAHQAGIADMNAITALAVTLAVPPPSGVAPTVPLDRHFEPTLPPGVRRTTLRNRIRTWIAELVPDHAAAADQAFRQFIEAVDGLPTPAEPDSAPTRSDQRVPPTRRPRPTLNRLAELVGDRTEVHTKAHMLHHREHIDEITQLIDHQLDLGNHARIAEPISRLLPIYHVLGRHTARRRHTQAIAEADESLGVSAIYRLHAFVEGTTNGTDWRAQITHLPPLLFQARIAELHEARRHLEAGKDPKGHTLKPTQIDAFMRLVDTTEIACLRISAALEAPHDPHLARRLLREAHSIARASHHESLTAATLLDAAALSRQLGNLPVAYDLANEAQAVAARQRNDRRHLKAHLERARILAARGEHTIAWHETQEARSLYTRLQADERGRPLPEWYEPPLRHAIEAVEALLDLPDGPPDEHDFDRGEVPPRKRWRAGTPRKVAKETTAAACKAARESAAAAEQAGVSPRKAGPRKAGAAGRTGAAKARAGKAGPESAAQDGPENGEAQAARVPSTPNPAADEPDA